MSLPVIAAVILSLDIARALPQGLVTTTDSNLNNAKLEADKVPIDITKFHVNSKIQFRYATTEVEAHMKNPGTLSNEADFRLVLPDSAFISNFSMIIAGVEYVAEVKEKEEARNIFDEALEDGRGAGIVLKSLREANVFKVSTNIEAGSKVVFKLMYEELLERQAGVYKHTINIDQGQIIDDLKIEVFINESLPVSKIFIPELLESNELDFEEKEENKLARIERNVDGSENNARIIFAPDKLYQTEAGDQGIDGQFVVEYDVNRRDQDSEIQVVDGYFVHYFVPDNLETLAKHVVFVLDVSGSMDGEKIKQLKDSMFTVLDDMDEKDYFSIITFNDGVSYWNPQLENKEEYEYDLFSAREEDLALIEGQKAIKATKENKDHAINHVLELQADGSTNLNDVLIEGIQQVNFAMQTEQLPKDIKSMIIFLSDGEATSGETRPEVIKENIKANNTNEVPIFSIGFGRDADFELIKDISLRSNAFSKKIYEGSDAALQLEDFFDQISSPLLSDLKFKYVGGFAQNSSSDTSLKTFFRGGEFIIVGKLEQPAENQVLKVQVEGEGFSDRFYRDIQICLRPESRLGNIKEINNQDGLPSISPPSTCHLPPTFPPRSRTQNFMKKLHAFLNIKQLIKKPNEENNEKALKLALENNFVTDITSLVVVRPDDKPTIASLEDPFTSPSYPSFAGGLRGSVNNLAFSPQAFAIGSLGGFASHSIRRSKPSLLARRTTIRNTFKATTFRTTTVTYRTTTFTTTTTTFRTTLKSFKAPTTTFKPPTTFFRTTSTYPPTTTTFRAPTRLFQTTSAYPPFKASSTDQIFDNEENFDETISSENGTDIHSPIVTCSGNLTLFSKTYFRGDEVTFTYDEQDLTKVSFENKAVTASVTGECCWIVFSDKEFTGNSKVLSRDESYTGVTSLGQLFREISSVRKMNC